MDYDTTLDKIYIRDITLRCIIGIFPEERREKQDIIINVLMHADISRAARSDRLEDTVDYKAVKLRIIDLVEKSKFMLVERLAQAVADICLEPPLVQRATVTIDKPGALRFARSVAVEITRQRS